LLVRYIENGKNGQPCPVGRLIGLFSSASTSGEALKDNVCQLLEDVSLSLDLLVGQSYDGAENCEASKAAYRPEYSSSVQRQLMCGAMHTA